MKMDSDSYTFEFLRFYFQCVSFEYDSQYYLLIAAAIFIVRMIFGNI